ncbi:type II secretion system F family protein [Caballeronia sp. LP003]|uniref:type II secretion system F family protein n=1 Tax=Caballeronia sp. LP003 TaxID=3038551 RepID=UPI0028577A95|nr:type II secretion system F family protein [Caballeronia sp. LP003]MDR5791734.1 type II secretion system F family protein [Caballeronia sp. LP003]
MSNTLSWGVRKRLYRQAASQSENGKVLTKILEDFRDRQHRRHRRKVADRVHQVWRKVVDGQTLVSAMDESLTDLERTLLGSGEKAGRLAESMNLILDVKEMTGRMTRALIGSFFSPCVYMVSLYVVLYVLGAYIVPQFELSAPVSKWTGWAYVMYLCGQIAVGWYAPVLLIALVTLIGTIAWALPRWTGRGRNFCDKYVFPFTVYREVTGFSWLVSYATLISAGVPDTEALSSQLVSGSPWLKSRLLPIKAGLRNGLNMAEAMRRAQHEFPSLDLIDEVSAYVGYADFPEKIQKVCKDHAKTIESNLILKGMIFSFIFLVFTFGVMAILQLGSNDLSTTLTGSMGF